MIKYVYFLLITMAFLLPVSESRAATEVCQGMYRDNQTIECLSVIAGKQMDAATTEVCQGMYRDNQTIECLSVIAGKQMDAAATEVCQGMYRDNQTIECLREIAVDVASVQTEEPAKTGQAKNEAVEFCRTDVPPYDKDECLAVAASSSFIDEGALSLCKWQSAHNKVDCLSVIADRTYVPALIEECRQRGTSSSRLEACLLEYGHSIISQTNQEVYYQSYPPNCAHENFYGKYPEGGGCNFDGCWTAGGGCNFHGCWTAGGGCSFDGCFNEAPTDGICEE